MKKILRTGRWWLIIIAIFLISWWLIHHDWSKAYPQWWAIIIALFLGVLGIFLPIIQDGLKALFKIKQPILKVIINLQPPDCHKTFLSIRCDTGETIFDITSDTYYLRFRVCNEGNYLIEDAEVMITDIMEKTTNGLYQPLKRFIPLNLLWSNQRTVTMSKIQPKLFKNCDFGHIVKYNPIYSNLKRYGITTTPNVVCNLDTFVETNMGSHILLPGEYKIVIVFAGNNVKPETKTYLFKFEDQWMDNETDMFNNNIVIKEER
jgi:hypothetical protein